MRGDLAKMITDFVFKIKIFDKYFLQHIQLRYHKIASDQQNHIIGSMNYYRYS